MALFDIQGLTFTYPEGKRPALSNICLAVEEGEFLVVCGKSGCGKSTLLRHFKEALTPHGQRDGALQYKGKPLAEIDLRQQAAEIGFVLQKPDNQIVTDKVWHELAYGLESLGVDSSTIRLRVAEMASFFGIQSWYHKNVAELSGGQKQLLNLASIMAMQPTMLILDEPTSQLDPIAASDFLFTIKKINRELGTTIVLSEHRLEDALPLADRALVMSRGRIAAKGKPREIGYELRDSNDPMLYAMPAPMRIYLALESREQANCPITVRDGKEYLNKYEPMEIPLHNHMADKKEKPVLQMKDVWFRYKKDGQDVLRDLNFSVEAGTLYCIAGGNGTGKTTALYAIAGVCRAYRGKVKLNGENILKLNANDRAKKGLAMLPQDPQSLFLCNTIEEDLYEMLAGSKHTAEQRRALVAEVAEQTEITELLHMHPYDVSGGEQQRAALAKVLLTDPQVLLLDEPTKGMDSFFKHKFAQILQKMKESGVTIIMVSHDVEFCAEYADKCALFFDGGIVTEKEPRAFFSGNSFYTTAANRMGRHRFKHAVTVGDVIELCKLKQQ